MNDKSKTEQYVEYINSNILPFVDYDKMQESYDTDMTYGKGVLRRLHDAMCLIYGGEHLSEDIGNEGFVVVPGTIQGKKSGKFCIVLLELDLSSSGEHWGTSFLCRSGVISQSEAYSNHDDASEMRKAIKPYGEYDYCYTASIPRDLHISNSQLPKGLADILSDFRNHRAILENEEVKP